MITERLVATEVDPGRSCTIELADTAAGAKLTYAFAPVDVGPGRGGTAVTASAVTASAPVARTGSPAACSFFRR